MNPNYQFPFDAAAFYRYSTTWMTQTFGLREKQRCCYPSKRCQNPRVFKRNGELHRLCEYHRMKANVNQRRLEQRRRMRNNSDAQDKQSQQEKLHQPAPQEKRERQTSVLQQNEGQERLVLPLRQRQQPAPSPPSKPQLMLPLKKRQQRQHEASDQSRSQRFSLPDLSSVGRTGGDLDAVDMHFMDEFLSETDLDLPPLTPEEQFFATAPPYCFDPNTDTRMSI